MMFFNNPKVRGYLLKKGEVYTLRAKHRREGRDLLVEGPRFRPRRLGFGLIGCVKELRGPLQARRLAPYVRASGMDDAKEWIAVFKGFMGGPLPGVAYVYRVQLLKDAKTRKTPALRKAKTQRPKASANNS